jgi:hypothetical protein
VLHGVEVDATALQLVDIKLLRAAAGKGQQQVHYDVPEYELARQSYTVLMYLTATGSTAVPKVPLTELRDTFTEGEKRPSRSALRKLQRDNFHTWRVEAGDLLAFNAAVPHFGVANPDRHDRYVLFLHFSPRGLPLHDTEEQRYPHGVPSPRAKRPYEELQPTQKWKRRKKLQTEVAAAVEKVGCPLEAINQPPVPSPAELIHLSTAVREQIRTVPSLHIPCEQSMINCTVDAKSFFLFHSPLQHAQASIAGGLVASMMRRADQHCMTIVRVTQQLLMLARVELEREDGKRGGHKALLSCRAGEQQVRDNRSTRLCCV